MDLGLKDARVFVAASSQGLGAAAAQSFSREGAVVAINGRDETQLEVTANALRKATGGKIIPVAGDVTDSETVQRIVVGAAREMGGLDVLITNAGGPPGGTFDAVTPEQFQRAFDLAVLSAVYLIRAALPYLRQSTRPAILTITSLSVKQPVDNLLLSNSVRMAVIGLTKSLANELGPEGIRVNSILPGWTMTERVEYLLQGRADTNRTSVADETQRITGTIPLGRIGTPEEFANVAVFLCSPAAGYIHGAMIPVDGGAIQASL
jgi:3-oxoacyl-[acyl-carrier protein] reductase